MTSFSASRELAASLVPSFQFDEVMRRQRETREAWRLFELRPNLSIGGARDVRPLVRQAELGGMIEPAMLLDIQATLSSGRLVKSLFNRIGFQFSALSDLVAPISELRPLEEDIARSISPRGEILDSASPVLGRIRAEIKVAHDRLISRLNEILGTLAGRQAVQEPIITIREGRYVLPVKADFKGQLRGVVHDTSASGMTAFIEPLDTVDLNNHWREAQVDERREIDRVLKRLSQRVARLAQAITTNVESLAAFDLVLAKAKMASNMRATEPEVLSIHPTGEAAASRSQRSVARPLIRLQNARHPLLTGNVVPTSVEVGAEFTILVITGPNTGGKTVVLKTVGLLTLMALAGLHIPADPGSKISVVDGVYADIGDEQSIEQSLSTFSSHMGNIIEILKVADERSLVLLDELGAGTDPTEGSALARAVLTHLLQRGISGIATTHYNELKAFAYTTPGIENASVEFNPETLTPTFKLAIGVPGRSNALAIAERLGLPQEIIAGARDMISPSQIQVENLLGAIQAEKVEAEENRRTTEERLGEVRKLEEDLQRRHAEVDEDRAMAVEEARQQALAELQDLLDHVRELGRSVQSGAMGVRELAIVKEKVLAAEREVHKRLRRPSHTPTKTTQELGPIRPGDLVLVRTLKQMGEVLTEADAKGEVEVQLGALKVRAKLEDLTKQSKRGTRRENLPSPPPSSFASLGQSQPSIQLDLRGRRVEEVIPEVEQYLNDAYLSGLPFVRLIHGKGTGALRQVVREQLARHPLVRSFSSAENNDGGDGVTVAVLAQ